MTRIFLGLYLAAFIAFTAFCVLEDGLLCAFPPFAAWHTYQIFVDLGTSIGLVSIWIYFDMVRQGLARGYFGVYLVGVALTGSISPLIYLLWRGRGSPPQSAIVTAPHGP